MNFIGPQIDVDEEILYVRMTMMNVGEHQIREVWNLTYSYGSQGVLEGAKDILFIRFKAAPFGSISEYGNRCTWVCFENTFT